MLAGDYISRANCIASGGERERRPVWSCSQAWDRGLIYCKANYLPFSPLHKTTQSLLRRPGELELNWIFISLQRHIFHLMWKQYFRSLDWELGGGRVERWRRHDGKKGSRTDFLYSTWTFRFLLQAVSGNQKRKHKSDLDLPATCNVALRLRAVPSSFLASHQ